MMNFNTPEINGFINDYVSKLRQGTATIFVGAGMSKLQVLLTGKVY
ncbi:hypothetical protein [Flavobacterium anhuiense]|nr:hypothetical protein [Flavobacterium anhuiense]URM38589.1 hypothetical protein LLY39_08660 [Flavobacterium anhuiense]